jgi:hypothetical protein
MPTRTLCPNCHGQRTVVCPAWSGSGGNAFAGVVIGICGQCHGCGQCRCDVCGGAAEVDPDGIRLEINFVPGKGNLAEGVTLPLMARPGGAPDQE